MAYDSFINRSNASATIPEEYSAALMSEVSQESIAMQIFPHLSMGNQQTRLPVLSALPSASWGTSDSSLYETTEVNWDNKYLDAAELYVTVPIPNKIIDDESIDIWGQVAANAKAVMAAKIDSAIFLGSNVPGQWTNFTGIHPTNVTRSNTYQIQATQATGGVAEDFNQACGLIEGDGFPVNFAVSPITFKKTLRSARDTTGQKLMDVQNMNNGDGEVRQQTTIDGVPLYFGIDGQWTAGSNKPCMILGDRRQGIFGIRTDMQIRFVDQGVFNDATGKITLNLLQQDMTAVILTFRLAFQVANTINLQNTDNAVRWPFATLMTA